MTAAFPTLFLSHGSPMIAVEPGPAGHFLQRLGPAIETLWGRPKAIVVMSPHTATPTPYVLGAAHHDTIHDFGGFPAALYEIRYDTPGEPQLASEIHQKLVNGGLPARLTSQGGLDHGIWTLLMHMFPAANLPVVPLSLNPRAKPADMLALGRLLTDLRRQGVLVIGSGSLTHNLQRFFHHPSPVDAPEEADCAAFRAWVHDKAQAADWPALLDYRAQAPHAWAMHPTDEHWLAFYFAAGAAMCDTDTIGPATSLRIHESVTHGHLAMDAYAFGAEAAKLANV
ncbi:class III extradiol ring-cleavage dioxygenase [Aquabacterium sp.]|uniref:DODA-type extradiol aromatic ring-opening family dioxygenase n=1 Tax=Aquabacterium sp. TaxID=1872578 RepID=UPI0035B4F42B